MGDLLPAGFARTRWNRRRAAEELHVSYKALPLQAEADRLRGLWYALNRAEKA